MQDHIPIAQHPLWVSLTHYHKDIVLKTLISLDKVRRDQGRIQFGVGRREFVFYLVGGGGLGGDQSRVAK